MVYQILYLLTYICMLYRYLHMNKNLGVYRIGIQSSGRPLVLIVGTFYTYSYYVLCASNAAWYYIAGRYPHRYKIQPVVSQRYK